MVGKKVKSRIYFLIIIMSSLIVGIFIFLQSIKKSIVYFLSPSEIHSSENISFNKKIRVGGMLKENSLSADKNSINFIITDFKNDIYVSYSGTVPNLIAENKGVVVEGKLRDKKYFLADRILAKHDENYMPPEVNAALKDEKK